MSSPDGRPTRTAPHFFSRKEMGERKEGEGNFSFPSPLPSKWAAFGRLSPSFCQGAPWGSPEGGIPPLGFLSHRFLCKESGAPAE